MSVCRLCCFIWRERNKNFYSRVLLHLYWKLKYENSFLYLSYRYFSVMSKMKKTLWLHSHFRITKQSKKILDFIACFNTDQFKEVIIASSNIKAEWLDQLFRSRSRQTNPGGTSKLLFSVTFYLSASLKNTSTGLWNTAIDIFSFYWFPDTRSFICHILY